MLLPVYENDPMFVHGNVFKCCSSNFNVSSLTTQRLPVLQNLKHLDEVRLRIIFIIHSIPVS
jgi:hypothetical protein